MRQEDLYTVLDVLDNSQIRYWLDGGWGVDVLAGKQTRVHHFAMCPNRKTGSEVEKYFREKYQCETYDNPEFQKVVELNITENKFLRYKLPKGMLPDIHSFRNGNLFLYRGLDKDDLKNFFLVGEYVKLTQSQSLVRGTVKSEENEEISNG